MDAEIIDDALRAATESSVAEAFAVPQVMASIKLIATGADGDRLQRFMTALKNAKLKDLKGQRVLFSGPYVGTFAVEQGLPLPGDQDARRALVRRVVGGEDVPGRVSAR